MIYKPFNLLEIKSKYTESNKTEKLRLSTKAHRRPSSIIYITLTDVMSIIFTAQFL